MLYWFPMIGICLGVEFSLALSAPSDQIVEDKVWLFAGNGRRKPFFYLDDSGELKGFNIDLARAVCTVAKKKCDFVLAEFTQCSYTQREINYAGEGLMSGWFDACLGYAITPDRKNAFDFTAPYAPGGANFAVAPGNPQGFDPSLSDFSRFNLTHLTGAPTNARCLGRLGKTFGNIIVAANLPEAKNLLLNGTAAALFVPRDNITGLEVLPEEFHCDEGGTGTMVKKGSTLPQWWNPAFNILVRTGAFAKLCQQASLTYNYDIGCLGETTAKALPTNLTEFLLQIHREEIQDIHAGRVF